jgi:hypothetical protein
MVADIEERRLGVSKNRVFRSIFGHMRDGVIGEWRKLCNEELNDLYSPNIVRVIISRMIWEWHVARLGRGEACTRFWSGNLRERDHWGDPGVDGKIILRWICRKWYGVWAVLVLLR